MKTQSLKQSRNNRHVVRISLIIKIEQVVYSSILCIMRETIATQDGFVQLHYTFEPTPSKLYHAITKKNSIEPTAAETNAILRSEIGIALANKIRQDPDLFMKLCTNRGGSFKWVVPIITDSVHCQFDVMEPYRSTDDTLPAYQLFANKHNGIYPDFTAWK